jgi:hypothetical protein
MRSSTENLGSVATTHLSLNFLRLRSDLPSILEAFKGGGYPIGYYVTHVISLIRTFSFS